MFDLKDPFRAYNILVMQMWYITLGACSLEHGDLFVHSFPLLRPVLMGLSFIEQFMIAVVIGYGFCNDIIIVCTVHIIDMLSIIIFTCKLPIITQWMCGTTRAVRLGRA